ncbi:TonB-dependent receptor plug domain-containing protein [Asticcacaulis excentricus]|uniref:TonB-dependent receptor plug n=1 Tax=Asticcacaulis excentricus (strain ATCC 15261 / DSM 4724 / KCTC 12464 / NCIMB 9791 / VKM B-1370 / CB 48) TaxID=573065 RepID=E8RQW8_ASTEC|nr:TonB-dependent receptor [Asticcacaulis excentricus]ADU12231.1 TonB-dependent receptor plug [Asticcacaulis excentricus CB 48]
MKRHFFSGGTSVLALLAAGTAMAAGPADTGKDAPADQTVQEITVKGEKNRTSLLAKEAEAYGTEVQVVGAKAIEDSGAINLAEAMQFLVKGVNIGYSPDEGEFTIRLDGGGDRDTLVAIDGVPTYDRGPALENIWGATAIDPHMIDRIEVYRGGNSLYFGSNGGIGVVNVITKKPDGTKKGEFGVSYGSFETREIWGNYAFPLDKDGKHSLMVYGTMLATDSPRIFDPEKFTDNVKLSGGVQDYPYNRNNIGAKYLWKIDDNTEFRANAIYVESWFQDPFPSGESYSPNTLRYPIIDAAFTKRVSDTLLFEASAYYSNPKLWNAELYPEICRIASGCVDPNNPSKTIPRGDWTGAVEPAFAHGFGTTNQFKSGYKEMGATVRATWQAHRLLEVIGGLQYVTYKDDSSEAFATPNNDFATTGVFVDLHPKLAFSPDTNISLAVRTDFSDAFDSKTIWKFGLRQPVFGSGYIRANGGTSYSLPQTNELYQNNPRPPAATSPVFTVGNPDLLPEETKTFAAAMGYSRTFGDVYIAGELGGFHTEITNRISTTSGLTPNVYFNSSAITEIKGATASLDMSVGNQWDMNFAYTSTDASETSGSRKGLQLGETPSWFSTASVNWTSQNRRWKFLALARIQGSEWARGGPAIAGTTKPAVNGRGQDTGVPKFSHNFGNYTVVNASVTYLAGEQLQHRFQLRIVNLFDEYYAERYGYGNNFYGSAFNRGEYTNTDDRYFYGYPFEGKPRSFYATFATSF